MLGTLWISGLPSTFLSNQLLTRLIEQHRFVERESPVAIGRNSLERKGSIMIRYNWYIIRVAPEKRDRELMM